MPQPDDLVTPAAAAVRLNLTSLSIRGAMRLGQLHTYTDDDGRELVSWADARNLAPLRHH